MSLTLIRTRAQREKRAASDLGRHGIETEHWTEIHSMKRRAPGGARTLKVEVERALAPSYIGAAAHPDHVLVEARVIQLETERRDVVGCLGTARDCELVALRERTGKVIDDTPQAPAKPKIGDLVELMSGPFQGWKVRVRAHHGKAMSVEANSGSKVVPLRIPYDHLRPG